MKLAICSLLFAACADEAPVAGLSCPCSSGYTCCADNVCVPDGDACSARTTMPTSVADHPCSAVEDQDADGVVDMDWTYFYDGAGRPSRQEGTSRDGATHLLETFTYDTAGRQVRDYQTLNGADNYDAVWSYDAFGRIAGDDEVVAPTSSDRWTYTGLTASVATHIDGIPDTRTTYQEDTSGNRLAGTLAYAGGAVYGQWSFGYTDAGAIAFSQIAFDNGTLQRHDWTYDTAGRLATLEGTSGFRIAITYDDQGREQTFTGRGAGPNAPTSITTNHYCE